MSGLEYLLEKNQSSQSSLGSLEMPSNLESALDEFVSYCEKQLPEIIDIDFKPVCFDISKDENNLVIGGEHGNVAVYHIPSKYKQKDEEICGEYTVVNVLFALNEKQVIISSAKTEIFFLDFPSLKVLGRLDPNYTPVPLKLDSEISLNVIMKIGLNEEWLYFCKYTEELNIVKLSSDKGFYSKKIEIETVKINSKVTCIDVSNDGTLIGAGSEDGKISLVHSDTFSSLQSTAPSSAVPIILAFGKLQKFLAAGFDDHSVCVWHIDTRLSLRYHFTKHTDLITGILFVNDNRHLVTASHDSCVIIWDIKVESVPYILNMYNTPVIHFKSSHNAKKIYYCQSKNSILVYQIPQLHRNARYRKHTNTVKKLIFLPNRFDLLSIGSDGQVILWDFRNDLLQESITLEAGLINGTIPSDGGFVLIASSKPCIYRWDFKTGCIDEFELTSMLIAIEFSSDNFSLAISDNLSRVIVYDVDVMEKKFILKGHRAPVTALAFIQEDSFLLSASMDSEIGKWDMASGERVAIFKGHLNSITAMTVSSDHLVYSASDEVINVWNYNGVLVYQMEIKLSDCGKINGIYISTKNKYFISLNEGRLSYWQMDNLSIMFQLDTMYPGMHLAVSKDEKFVAVAEGKTVFIEENPMFATNIRIVGKSLGSRLKYMKFVIDSQKKDSVSVYKEKYNHWVAVPYLIGISHILAYTNRIEDLNEALFSETNKAGFFSTVNNENPLSIAVDLEYKNVIDVCLKHMKSELSKKNIRAFSLVEKCLTKMNAIEYPDITKVYDLIFVRAEDAHLPAFCLHEAELPILYPSENLVVIPEEIMSKEFFSSTGRPIVFHHSLCLLDLEIGTNSSLEFLQSLLNGDPNVYNSRIVKEYLMCKWQKIKIAVNIQGCMYIVYMILLSIYTVNFMKSNSFFTFVIIAHLVLFSIEILQLVTDYLNYFFDVWNVIDLMRTWSFFFYMFNVFVNEVYSYDYLLAVIIFSWLRGISYFRMFDGTRYMVRLLGMVILDMRVFFTILAYSTIGFAFIFYLRNPETSFFIYLMTSYRLDLGDFNTDYTAVFDWVVFFFATMINPMIMLNLLISILSDTAANVSKDNYIANLQELTRMIIEVEKVMFWKKEVNQKQFLHLCIFTEDDPQSDKVLERCKYIKNTMDKMQKRIDTINEQMKSVNISKVDAALNLIQEDQEKLKEELSEALDHNTKILKKIKDQLPSSDYNN